MSDNQTKRTFLNKVYYYGPNVLTLLEISKKAALIVLIVVGAVKLATF